MEKKIFGTSLEAKTRVLVFNIACGLLSLAVISYVFFYSLKYDYNTLFAEHHQSLVELEELRQILNNIENRSNNTTLSQSQISKLQDEIKKHWDSYKANETKNSQRNDLILLALRIYDFFDKRNTILKEKEKLLNKQRDFNKLDSSIQIFLKNLNMLKENPFDFKNQIVILNQDISNIILSSLNLVEIKKDRNSALHNLLHILVLVIMCLIVIITILLSHLVLSNIKHLHSTLEAKIKEKTKELQDLNDSLQETIKKEVLESRKKDQIMYQQARLASMGEMIGNIAHQWRQPLNALMLLIQAFKVKSQNGKLTPEFINTQVNDGLKIAKKMSQTIEDFRNFFHSSSCKESFDLKENIEDSVSLVEIFLKQNEIELSIECPENIVVYGYKSSFSQVLLNLIKNSEDVLKERQITPAKIRISAYINQSESTQEGKKQEEFVQILFMDNGGGIRLKDIQKIFEPYFTTKHKSVGTGIGLYMSKQIIEKQMQGSIEAKNVKWNLDAKLSPAIECLQDCSSENNQCGALFIITIPLKSEE
ncbi:HAMP domain-containing sensor histidine kinase [Helicobacter sp.]|uniref:sensor histidine kinase n=1 Tax=Helicobacter sp. TaxID=218 RepID=UPI00258CB06C|nr:HAMP domain-containing sensor histidine kinase [Helicobacter sp.]MCI7766063.1 HAMP domain-containing histidine kinase [Helicobacter sp.]